MQIERLWQRHPAQWILFTSPPSPFVRSRTIKPNGPAATASSSVAKSERRHLGHCDRSDFDEKKKTQAASRQLFIAFTLNIFLLFFSPRPNAFLSLHADFLRCI
jgi:hypothetical protein